MFTLSVPIFYTAEHICLCNETTESLTHTVIFEKIKNLSISAVLGKHTVHRYTFTYTHKLSKYNE